MRLNSADDLLDQGYLHASRWFHTTESLWEDNKTEKSKKMSANGRLDFHGGLTDQDLNNPYLVLYNGRGKNACATVVERTNLELEFFVDHANYVIELTSLKEAYYLSAILNSSVPNKMMKKFQSSGLYGERNIHKKILDIYFPLFQSDNHVHSRVAELGEISHIEATKYIGLYPPQNNLTPLHLGKLRLDIKEYLGDELGEIDELLEGLIG